MHWTKEELDFLKENYSKQPSLKELSKQLNNRSPKSINHQAMRHGIYRPRFSSNKPSNRQSQKVIDKRYYENNKEKVYKRKMERRKKLKKEMVKIFGGKCSKCGYDKCIDALDFHHEGNKEKSISKLINNNSREKILKEAKKCILLCANCHRELHSAGP
jgi:predicted HNH restriction endonuclease